MIKDEHRVILYSVVASVFVWITNAAIEGFLLHQESFWKALMFQVSDFEMYVRLSTFFVFIIYGIITANIIGKNRRWGENLLKSKAKIKALLHAMPDLLFRISREGILLESVAGWESHFPSPLDQYLGERIDAFLSPEISQVTMDSIERALETGEIQIFEYPLSSEDEIRHYEARIVATGQSEVLSIIRDLTDRKMLEEKLRNLSLTDELTGLHNRRGFFVLGKQQFKLAERNKENLLLLYLDLDNLKLINDTHGHLEGDRVLVDAGNILFQTFRKSDIIARVGGDEFAVLLVDVAGSGVEAIISNRLDKNLEDFNEQENREYRLSFSKGMARYDPENPCTIDELLTRVDSLMYEEKKRKRKLTT